MVALGDYRRLALLVLIMFGIVVIIGGESMLVIYQMTFVQQQDRLHDIVRNQVGFVNAAIHLQNSDNRTPEETRDYIVRLIHQAHGDFVYKGFGKTGQLVLAARADDHIKFIFVHPHPVNTDVSNWVLPLNTPLAEPMRAALDGRSGWLVGTDFRGMRVLAAYAPIAATNMGIVAKIDVEELRAPFVRAGVVLALFAIPLVGAVSVLFFLIGEPMVRRLQRSEARYRSLFDNLRIGAAVFERSADGKDFVFRDFNSAGEHVAHLQRQDVVGRCLKDVFPGVDLVGLPGLIEDVWRTGRDRAMPPMYYSDGRIAGWREGHVYGLPSGEIVVLFEDISDRIRAQGAVLEKERLYRRLFNQAPCAICVINTTTMQPVDFNNTILELLEYTRDELRRAKLTDFYVGFNEDELVEHIRFITATGGGETQTRWKTKRGLILTVMVSYSTVEIGGNTVVQMVATDISERFKSEARLRQLSADLQRATRANELGQMTSALSHELKQPLTAAMNYMNACRRTLASAASPSPLAFDLATKAVEQVDRASTFIRDIRSFISNPEPRLAEDDLNDTAREAASLIIHDERPYTVDVRFDLAEGLPPALIERTLIIQVLLHLFNNAFDVMASSPTRILTISTRPHNTERLSVAVRDTGPGVPSDLADRLFHPFVTTKSFGLGIGLSICKSIVEAHGGFLRFENHADGGATFWFTVPTHQISPGNSERDDCSG